MLPGETPQVWKSFYQSLSMKAFLLSQLATVPETVAAPSEATRPGSLTPIKPVLPVCLLARQVRFYSLSQRGLTLTDAYRKVPTTTDLGERQIRSCVQLQADESQDSSLP